jgi:hypothetical protein
MQGGRGWDPSAVSCAGAAALVLGPIVAVNTGVLHESAGGAAARDG